MSDRTKFQPTYWPTDRAWDGAPDGNEAIECLWCGEVAYWTEGEDSDRYDIGGDVVCKACHDENAAEILTSP